MRFQPDIRASEPLSEFGESRPYSADQGCANRCAENLADGVEEAPHEGDPARNEEAQCHCRVDVATCMHCHVLSELLSQRPCVTWHLVHRSQGWYKRKKDPIHVRQPVRSAQACCFCTAEVCDLFMRVK